MLIELLVLKECSACRQAEAVWRAVTEERGLELRVLDIDQPEGQAQARRLRLKTVPALVIDGELRAVGVQSPAEAAALLAPPREEAHQRMQQMGFTFSRDNRWFILAAQAYLMLAGLGLALQGSFLSDGPARPAFLHLFTLGFVTFLIYGLAAHMLPRFTGVPIREGIWPWVQMGLAHGGVSAYVLGFFTGHTGLIITGAVLAWLALLLFAVRVWPVLWPGPKEAHLPGCQRPKL